MKNKLKLGDFELFWLSGGRFELDGGAMFGVVPRIMWSKKYPSDEDNYIPMTASPILVKTPDALIVIESGLGNKLTDKQKRIFRLKENWNIIGDLSALGLNREDIDFVVLTHYDWDHASGVVMTDEKGQSALTFPSAKHVLQKSEWEDVLDPNIRSVNTYWPVNSELLKGSRNLELIEGEAEIVRGVRAIHTGGHNRGHQIVRMESGGQLAVHLGDLLPTHAHFNPLWVMAYDNFPLESIKMKEYLEKKYVAEDAWFTFYHDPFLRACKFDPEGNIIEKWPERTAFGPGNPGN
ncbi:MAG TPA: MBL fold metallo-hydrolase [Dissulfurispiraceae bacterium]|nr:MBL fold metallo-hydrolase [Dissulfurispiraceae bacterium]